MKLARSQELLRGIPAVIHIGPQTLAAGPRAAGIPVCSVELVPPAGGDPDRLRTLTELTSEPVAPLIARANATALERMLAVRPHLVAIAPAHEVIPDMSPDLVLHAGPPLASAPPVPPLGAAAAAGLVLEGVAATPDEAIALVEAGRVRLEPALDHGAVAPGEAVITASSPVWVVEDAVSGRRSYAPVVAQTVRATTSAADRSAALSHQRHILEVVTPALARALAARDPIALDALVGAALEMGDEGHHRTVALHLLLLREITPALAHTAAAGAAAVLELLSRHGDLVTGCLLPAVRLMLAAAEGVPFASVVTALARNGTGFGLQLASLPGRWFSGPSSSIRAPAAEAPAEASAPDIGDGSLFEAVGLGAFALAAAPAAAAALGVPANEAALVSREMARITLTRHPRWRLPVLDAGAPVGIDVLRVIEHNILPLVSAAASHPGAAGRIGATLVRPPWECFYMALPAFLEHCHTQRS